MTDDLNADEIRQGNEQHEAKPITAGGVPIEEVHEQQREDTLNEPVIADEIDDEISRIEGASIYDLARRMQFAIRDFAEAYARHMSERDVPEANMIVHIRGRSDSEIKISFGSSVYQSSTSQMVQVEGYGDPIHVIDEFMERWDRTRIRAMPMITHKR